MKKKNKIALYTKNVPLKSMAPNFSNPAFDSILSYNKKLFVYWCWQTYMVSYAVAKVWLRKLELVEKYYCEHYQTIELFGVSKTEIDSILGMLRFDDNYQSLVREQKIDECLPIFIRFVVET